MNVMTVCGEIPVERMGVTLMHEHLLANGDFSGNDYNMVVDEVDVAIGEMKYFTAAGGKTIVDLTWVGLGQDVRGLKKISEATGVNIITSTGFYQECSYPEYVKTETADELARRMIRDVREGIDGTTIRPGIFAEIANGYPQTKMTVLEEKVFTAVAYAARETGLPVSTHCWAGEMGLAQIDVLTRNGVRPEKIIIGHLATNPLGRDRLFAIADKGVYLGIDCIGYIYEQVVALKDPDKARWVRDLIDRGHLHRITISQDSIRKLLLKHYHGIGYDYLLLKFLPMLRDAGVTEEQIRTILVDNPRDIFSTK